MPIYTTQRVVPKLMHSLMTVFHQVKFIFIIFILIGALIAALIACGAIPTLMFYGAQFISPRYFFPVGMLICSVMSLFMGTSWGTIGTIGVAFMSLAESMGIPLPMAAGMIVSGAFFGDKLSPISDTTLLSAWVSGTDLFDHIKGMAFFVMPAYLVTLLVWFYLSDQNSGLYHLQDTRYAQSIKNQFMQSYHISTLTLLPFLTMFAFCVTKHSSVKAISYALLTALIIAVSMQKMTFIDLARTIFWGPSIQENGFFTQGGIYPMLFSMFITSLLLILGSVLEAYGILSALVNSVVSRDNKPFTLVTLTVLLAIMGNILMAEAYLSIILVGGILKGFYQNTHLQPKHLSMSLEQGATFSTPIIPWTTSGLFTSSVLGVSTLDYMPWSIMNWLAPFIYLLMLRKIRTVWD